MKSVLYKLVFVTIILGGWVAYDKRDAISDFISASGNKIPTQVSDLFSSSGNSDKVITTTVYKWKDENGEIQFSNTKPAHMPNAEIQQFRSDTNVVAAVKAPPAKKAAASPAKTTSSSNDKKEEKSAGVFDSITGKMDEIAKLKKAIETPKTIPAR